MSANEELLARLDEDDIYACQAAAAAIRALENDLAIANLAWKAENNRRKQVERETIERCANVCELELIMNTDAHYKACYTRPEQAKQTHALYDAGILKAQKAIRALAPSAPAADGKAT